MVTITITITDVGDGECDFKMDGHGDGCSEGEVLVSQALIRKIRKFMEPALIEILVPPVEVITKTQDKPLPN